MFLRKLCGVILEKISTHIRFAGVVMRYCGVKLRFQHCQMHRAVRVRGFLELQGQNCAHQFIRTVLRAQEIAQGISHKGFPAIGGSKPLCILQHVRVGAHDHICTPVCKILGKGALAVHNGVAVLNAPMHTHHHKICCLACCTHLPLDHIGLAGVDHIGCHGAALRNTVGVLSVRKIGNGHAINGLQGDTVVVRFAFPQAGGYHILRHTVPKAERCCNTGSAFVVGVVVGKAEHPHACPVQCPCTIARRGKARVGRWLQLIVAERFLVDPVDVLLGVERSNVLVAIIKAVAGSVCTPGGLLVNGGVDQIIAGRGKTQRLHHWLRQRFRLFLYRGSRLLRRAFRRACSRFYAAHRDAARKQEPGQKPDAHGKHADCRCGSQKPGQSLSQLPPRRRAVSGRSGLLFHDSVLNLLHSPAFDPCCTASGVNECQIDAIRSPMLYRPGSFLAR